MPKAVHSRAWLEGGLSRSRGEGGGRRRRRRQGRVRVGSGQVRALLVALGGVLRHLKCLSPPMLAGRVPAESMYGLGSQPMPQCCNGQGKGRAGVLCCRMSSGHGSSPAFSRFYILDCRSTSPVHLAAIQFVATYRVYESLRVLVQRGSGAP